MTRLFLVAAAAFALAGTAQAQTVDQRHADQQARITQGVESGQLTGREARHDERQQGRIDATEARMRARNGGSLNYAQRARLQSRESRASAHIYRTKHNVGATDPLGVPGRLSPRQTRIRGEEA